MSKKAARKRRKSGSEQHERRQQRLEARREARALEEARRAKAERRRSLVRRVVIGVVAGGVTSFLLLRNQPPGVIDGREVMTFSTSGVNVHRLGPIDYETSPPVSGPHAPQPAPCGTHAKPIPDEEQVHILEHGGIGVQYRPDLGKRQIARIEDIVSGYDSHVFSAPYPGMEPGVAVTSWGRKMELDSVDEPAIRSYIDAFRGKGPEDRECPNTAGESFEPEPTPNPT